MSSTVTAPTVTAAPSHSFTAPLSEVDPEIAAVLE